MLSLLVLIICVALLLFQIRLDYKKKGFNILNVSYLFQVYFIVQLPLSSCFTELFQKGITDARITETIDDSTRTQMLMIVLVAYICYTIGALAMRNYHVRLSESYAMDWNTGKVRLLIIAMMLWGYMMFTLLMRRFGGISGFLAQIEHWRNIGLNGNAIYTASISKILPSASVIYLLFNAEKLRNGDKKKWIFLIITIIICSFPALIMGFRSYLFNILLMLVIAYNYSVKKIKIKYFIIGVILFAVYFSFYSIARAAGTFDVKTLQSVIANMSDTFQRLLLRSRGSEMFSIVLQDLNRTHDYHMSMGIFLNPLSVWIPRSIWANKPTAEGLLFTTTFFGKYGIVSGISGTCLGEFYWEYGIIGVIVSMFLFGIIFTLFQNTFFNNKKNISVLFIFIEFSWAIIRVAETPSGSFNDMVITIMFVTLVKFFLRKRKVRQYGLQKMKLRKA